MGHYCRICGRSRPNERFSGGGHRIHVCRECQKIPFEERQAMDALTEITGFLHDQSRISPKNVKRLVELSTWTNKDVAEQAAVMLDVARMAPGKRRRLQRIRSSHPELWRRLIEVGLVYPTNAREGVWAALGAGLSSEELCWETTKTKRTAKHRIEEKARWSVRGIGEPDLLRQLVPSPPGRAVRPQRRRSRGHAARARSVRAALGLS